MHGIPKYIDKNHAGTLIIWDKLVRHLCGGGRETGLWYYQTIEKLESTMGELCSLHGYLSRISKVFQALRTN